MQRDVGLRSIFIDLTSIRIFFFFAHLPRRIILQMKILEDTRSSRLVKSNAREQACKFALCVLSSLDLNRSRRYKFPLTETTRVDLLSSFFFSLPLGHALTMTILLCCQKRSGSREKPRRNVYKFAATCDYYEDSIRWDVACSVDLWVSNAAWPPLRASCNLVHYDLSIHRFSVASKASTSQLRAKCSVCVW